MDENQSKGPDQTVQICLNFDFHCENEAYPDDFCLTLPYGSVLDSPLVLELQYNLQLPL